jgi:hypothetical protein
MLPPVSSGIVPAWTIALPINVEKHLHNTSKIAQGVRYLYVTVADLWKRISMVEIMCS